MVDKDHLINRRTIVDNYYDLPSVALCGLIYKPQVIKEVDDLPECLKCAARLQELEEGITNEVPADED